MIILSLDSSRKNQSMTIFDESSGKRVTRNQENRSSQLMAMITEAFKEEGLKPQDIALILVSTGPGSFTGIRTALTIAKTLAAQLDLKIFAANNFELKRFELEDFSAPVILPAGKNDYFISEDSNYTNLESNYFSLELDGKAVTDFENENLSELVVDYYKSLESPPLRDYKEVDPYYLREPSIGAKKK